MMVEESPRLLVVLPVNLPDGKLIVSSDGFSYMLLVGVKV